MVEVRAKNTTGAAATSTIDPSAEIAFFLQLCDQQSASIEAHKGLWHKVYDEQQRLVATSLHLHVPLVDWNFVFDSPSIAQDMRRHADDWASALETAKQKRHELLTDLQECAKRNSVTPADMLRWENSLRALKSDLITARLCCAQSVVATKLYAEALKIPSHLQITPPEEPPPPVRMAPPQPPPPPSAAPEKKNADTFDAKHQR